MNVKAITDHTRWASRERDAYEARMKNYNEIIRELGAVAMHHDFSKITVQVDDNGLSEIDAEMLSDVQGYSNTGCGYIFYHVDFMIDKTPFTYVKVVYTEGA